MQTGTSLGGPESRTRRLSTRMSSDEGGRDFTCSAGSHVGVPRAIGGGWIGRLTRGRDPGQNAASEIYLSVSETTASYCGKRPVCSHPSDRRRQGAWEPVPHVCARKKHRRRCENEPANDEVRISPSCTIALSPEQKHLDSPSPPACPGEVGGPP